MGRVISIEFVNERRTAVDGKTKFLHQMQRLPGKNPGSAIMFSHQTSGFDEAAPRRTACPLNAIETTSQRDGEREKKQHFFLAEREFQVAVVSVRFSLVTVTERKMKRGR